MRKIKESGFQWIGSIPIAWNLKKLKYMVKKAERGTAPDYTDNEETKVVNQATFSRGSFDTSNIRFSTKPAVSSRGLLFPNDILLASTGGGVLGKTCYYEQEEEYVADSHVTIIRTCTEILLPKFLYYFFAINYDTFNAMMAEGSTNQTELQRDLLLNMYVPVPPLEEQCKIIVFLNGKCAEIDSLISDIQSELDILKQYKRSLVYRAISKGIHNTETKGTDSDVWGAIPVGWKLVDIKYLFEIVKRIAGKEGYNVLSVTQKGLRVKDIESNDGQQADNYSGYQLVFPTDYVMNHMDLLTGWVDCSTMLGVTSPDYRVFRLTDKKNNNLNYYKYAMQCCYMCRIFYSLGQGVSNLGRWRLQTATFCDFKVPVPPIDEQQEIAKFLETKCTAIDSIIFDKQQQLSTLDEYKKSLIYEYVTGKKEVTA
jgi:type I restriction enzyme S subunit